MSKKIQLTESQFYRFINKSVSDCLNELGYSFYNKNILKESQESKSQSQAIRLVMDTFNWDYQKANDFVRNTLRNEITPLRDNKLAKFTLGVTRMYCDRQLNNGNIISDLNSTLKLMIPHLNEYDKNLNGLSAQELINRFAQVRQSNFDKEREEVEKMEFSGDSNYTIVPINSYEEAQQYYKYTYENDHWCLTHMRNMYDSYSCDGINQIYFCLRKGFEKVRPIVNEETPLDEYGLSMISVIVNEKGELTHCTTRWNHSNGGTDSAMSPAEISRVIGMRFHDVFKPNNKWEEILSNIKERLKNGEEPKNVFDSIGYPQEGFATVELKKKYNFINDKNEILSDQWFDVVGNFNDGFAVVKLNGKGWNYLKPDGTYISNQWYDNVGDWDFNAGFAKVNLKNKGWNFLKPDGTYLYNQWYDDVGYFNEGFAKVNLKGKGWNFLKPNGTYLFDEWFDYVFDFNEGFAKVYLDDKGYNYINTNGKTISDMWFYKAWGFSEGFAKVRNVDKGYNFIKPDGTYISYQWFDDAGDFHKGVAKIELKSKGYNFIKPDGTYLSDIWFDYVIDFYNGITRVKLDDKGWNFINIDGNLISNQWFDVVGNFNDGFAVVKLNGEWFRINGKGKKIN